ncbi:MAG: DUF885 domain-containing protein [Nocardioidaceae bacterium]
MSEDSGEGSRQAVDALAADHHEHRLATMPTWAHLIGEYRYADRFEEVGREAEDRAAAQARRLAARAEEIPVDGLDEQRRITRAMVAWDAAAQAELAESRLAELAADPVFGVQAGLGVRLAKLPLPDAEVAEAMVGKLTGVATYFRDLAERARDGVRSGRTPAQFAVVRTVAQLDEWLSTPLRSDPLLGIGPTPGDVDRDGLVGRLTTVLENEVRPAVALYREVLRGEVAPRARSDERCGLTWLPDGDQTSAQRVRYYTTTELTPQEIHEVGLRQVDALAEEYRALGPEALGLDDPAEILAALRDDPALHHSRGEEVVADAREALAKASQAAGEWFGVLPRSGCEVEATTSGAVAYYFAPAKDGSRGGVFFMNVSEPEGWGRFEVESTAYHEGIPGHHLQVGVAAELDGLPEFRKRAFVTAYGEGWGLYTERLADEMGLYSTPLDRMGMLAADSMRAGRLVVDTGMHALGWSRQRAIDYLMAHTPMHLGHATAEIDRYAVTPGQALSYMVGRLEIQRIRREAEQRQGAAFDVRAFHDAVLDSGPMPLGLLAEVVARRLP